LDAIVTDAFSKLDTPSVLARLDAAKIANGRLNSVADLSTHPFLTNTSARVGDIEIDMAALPVRTSSGNLTSVPALGQDTDSIRAEFAQISETKAI